MVMEPVPAEDWVLIVLCEGLRRPFWGTVDCESGR